VPDWKTVGVLPGLRISYQRIPDALLALTEWLTTSASWSPKFRYASRYISRSPSESSFVDVPDCGMHVPVEAHTRVNVGTETVDGPVKVLLAGVVQSTWNFNNPSVLPVITFGRLRK
jgi:hypothetical protein